MVLLTAVAIAVCACGEKNQPDQGQGGKKVNYDQMIGSWKLTSYTVKWVNLDESKVEKDFSYQDGYLVIEKKKTDDGDAYFYKENFALEENREEYYGMLEIDAKNNFVYLRADDGSQRRDNAEIYDFVVSFPADGKMEWTYERKCTHANYTSSHNCQRNAKAVFVKQ